MHWRTHGRFGKLDIKRMWPTTFDCETKEHQTPADSTKESLLNMGSLCGRSPFFKHGDFSWPKFPMDMYSWKIEHAKQHLFFQWNTQNTNHSYVNYVASHLLIYSALKCDNASKNSCIQTSPKTKNHVHPLVGGFNPSEKNVRQDGLNMKNTWVATTSSNTQKGLNSNTAGSIFPAGPAASFQPEHFVATETCYPPWN